MPKTIIRALVSTQEICKHIHKNKFIDILIAEYTLLDMLYCNSVNVDYMDGKKGNNNMMEEIMS